MANSVTAGHAYVLIGAKIDASFNKALASISKAMKNAGSALQTSGSVVSGFGAAIMTPLRIAAESAITFQAALKDMADRAGVSTEFLSEVAYTASLVGVSTEELAGSLTKMSAALFEVSKNSVQSKSMMTLLKLNVSDLLKMKPEEQFNAIADAISKLGDQSTKVGAVRKIFGKEGAKLLPLMAGGKAGVEAGRKEGRRLGVTVTKEDAELADKADDMYARLTAAVQGLANTVGKVLIPEITRHILYMTNLIARLREYLAANPQIIDGIYKFGKALLLAGAAMVGIGSVLKILGVAVSPGGVLAVLVAILLYVTGSLDGVIKKWGETVLAFQVGGRSIGNWLSLIAQAWQATIPVFQAVGTAIVASFSFVWAVIKENALKILPPIHEGMVVGFWEIVRAIADAFLWVGIQIRKAFWGAAKGVADAMLWIVEKSAVAQNALGITSDERLKEQLDEVQKMRANVAANAAGKSTEIDASVKNIDDQMKTAIAGQQRKVRELYAGQGTAASDAAKKAMTDSVGKVVEAAKVAGASVQSILGEPIKQAVDGALGAGESGVKSVGDIMKDLGREFTDVAANTATGNGQADVARAFSTQKMKTFGSFSARAAESISGPAEIQKKQLGEITQIRKIIARGVAEGASVVYQED